MIEGWSPFAQALSGTLFTWAVTALGAALVFVVPADIKPARLQRVLHAALGFSAGVMVAASFWSLLVPAFEFAEELGWGAGAWVPVAIGFAAGAVFVFCAGRMLPEPDAEAISKAVVSMAATHLPSDSDNGNHGNHSHSHSHGPGSTSSSEPSPLSPTERADHREASKRARFEARRTWRRILLVVVAITVHNIPEGAAVGVGFGGAAVGGGSAAFRAARALAIGIGLQNFPEGLAVSLPLMRAGFSRRRAFWYGQLSGMVEPVAGVLGAVLVALVQPVLPYALAFAAGAMIYVVVNDLIPEAHTGMSENHLTSWGVIVGFLVMMIMDTTL